MWSERMWKSLVWILLTSGCYEELSAGTGVPLHASAPSTASAPRGVSEPSGGGLSTAHEDIRLGIAVEPNDRNLVALGWRVEDGPLPGDRTWNGPTIEGERALWRSHSWLRGYVEGSYLSLHDHTDGTNTPPTVVKARSSSSTSFGFGIAASPGGDDGRFRARAGVAYTHEQDAQLGELDSIGVQLTIGFLYHPPLCGGPGACIQL
jgi:hypothetical protein